MRKAAIIAIVEIGMLAGVVLAALLLPRSTPLRTFLIIGGAALACGNALLFRTLDRGASAGAESSADRQTNRASQVSLLVMLALLVLLFLVNKL